MHVTFSIHSYMYCYRTSWKIETFWKFRKNSFAKEHIYTLNEPYFCRLSENVISPCSLLHHNQSSRLCPTQQHRDKSCPEFPLARNFSLCKFPTLFRSRFCKNVTDQKNTGNFVIFCRVHQNNVLTSSSQLVQ